MIHILHDTWSQVVDYASFGFINALQLRKRSGSHTLEEFLTYSDQWTSRTIHDYLAIPKESPRLTLSESGVSQSPSPLTCDEPVNNQTHLHTWLGPQGWKSPTVILLHGVMSVSDVGYRLWAKKLNALGFTAIFCHLPYHYNRTPKNSLSGEMALSSHLIRTAEGIRQSVIEMRLLCQTLKEKGSPHIIAWGTSYGGWVSSLLAVVEKSLTSAWLVEPISDADHAIWQSPAAITLRWQAKRLGIDRNTTLDFMPLVCPTYHQPITPSENILFIGGIFDQIAPVKSLRKLNLHWKGSHYAEFRQGHIGYQLMPHSLKLARKKIAHLFPETT